MSARAPTETGEPASNDRVVILGPMEPVLRSGLRPSLAEAFLVENSCLRGPELIDAATTRRVRAVIVRRSDVVLMQPPKQDVIVVGVSTVTSDVIVAFDGQFAHFPNPTPESIRDLIATEATSRDSCP